MANSGSNMDRRSVLRGIASASVAAPVVVSTAAVAATPADIVAAIQGDGSSTTADMLTKLAAHFRDAAKLIDPTITDIWCGFDIDSNRLFWVHLERKETPFVSRRARGPVETKRPIA